MMAGVELQLLMGRRILIVDDSRDITSLVADMFSMAGARPVQVNSGSDAMVYLMAGGFDIVILDMVMPQPDGWCVIQFMRSRMRWLERTIILTGNQYEPRVTRTVKEFGVACLLKPFDLTDLLTTACRLLARSPSTTAA